MARRVAATGGRRAGRGDIAGRAISIGAGCDREWAAEPTAGLQTRFLCGPPAADRAGHRCGDARLSAGCGFGRTWIGGCGRACAYQRPIGRAAGGERVWQYVLCLGGDGTIENTETLQEL